MYCPKCGELVNETDVLCINCGVNLAAADEQLRTEEPAPPAPVQPMQPMGRPNYPPAQQPPVQQPYYPPVQQAPIQQAYYPPGQVPVQPPYPQAYGPAPIVVVQGIQAKRQNYIITKFLIIVGVLVTVFFFLPFMKVNADIDILKIHGGGSLSGFNMFLLSFKVFALASQARYLPGGVGGIVSILVIAIGILMMLFMFIPVAGVLTLLSLFNSRAGVKAVKSFASAAFSGMLIYLILAFVVQSVVNKVISTFPGELGSFGAALAMNLIGFAFWVCFVGILALMIGTRIDLNNNRPYRY